MNLKFISSMTSKNICAWISQQLSTDNCHINNVALITLINTFNICSF